jgi:hypothetical protein
MFKYNKDTNKVEYSATIEKNENNPTDSGKNIELCQYYERYGSCAYGSKCPYTHGEHCDTCGLRCLHPHIEEFRQDHKQECSKKITV